MDLVRTAGDDIRLRRIRILAGLVCVLSLLVVALSAWLRLKGAGLGCLPWPQCYGRLLSGVAPEPFPLLRRAHRMVASLALLSAFGLVWMTRRPRPLRPFARQALLLLLLMLALALVGFWSADPHRVAVNAMNIAGGLGLVALSWRLVLSKPDAPSGEPDGQADALRPLVSWALLLTLLPGCLIGARYAASACTTLPGCDGIFWPTQGWHWLNPLAYQEEYAADAGAAGGVMLHLLHRYAALLTLALLGLLAMRARRRPGLFRAVLWGLTFLLAEMAIGALLVAGGHPLGLGVLHNVGAALVLAVLASLVRASRPGEDKP